MDIVFMNSGNNKTSDCHRLLLNLSDTINLNRKNMKKSNKDNRFKISAVTWNETLDLPGGSFSISDIQDYFEHILEKKHGEKTNNPSIRIYVNKIESRITF